MIVYRITFAMNTIASVKPVDATFVLKEDGDYYYENDGMLIYAIIRAHTDQEAHLKATELIEKVTKGK